MADSTTTTAAAILLAENLAKSTADYVWPRVKISPLCLTEVPEGETKTVKFPKNAKNAAATVAEGGAGMTADAWTPTSVSVTGGQVGVLRSPSKLLSNLKPGFFEKMAQDAARLLAIKLETDLALLFASATLSSSNTTQAFSVAHYLAAQAKLENNDTEGPYTFVLWNKHFGDLKNSVASSTAALFGNAMANVQKLFEAQMQGPAGSDAELFGSKIKRTSVNTTANAAVDAVSAVMVDGSVNPVQAAIGITFLYDVQYIIQEIAQKLTTDIAGHWGLGSGLTNTDSICKIINAI